MVQCTERLLHIQPEDGTHLSRSGVLEQKTLKCGSVKLSLTADLPVGGGSYSDREHRNKTKPLVIKVSSVLLSVRDKTNAVLCDYLRYSNARINTSAIM